MRLRTLPDPLLAEKLGRMSYAELKAIQHCECCLEPYDDCQCQAGRERRRHAVAFQDKSSD